MKISENGINLIKKWEGLYLHAYYDCVGVITIGYGITNADKAITGTTIKKGMTISKATADKWLRESLDKKYAPKVMKYDDKYHWNQNQFDALVSFCYNIGNIDGLTANGTRSIDTIAKKILEYCKAGGKYVKGLYDRRKDEHRLFTTPYKPSITSKALLSLLAEYHAYIKAHGSKFYRHYDSSMTTFAKAKKAIGDGKEVGLTCVVPLRWALAELGIKRADGKSLISGNDGSFEPHYTGDVKKYFDLITTGPAIGLSPKEAIDKGLLKEGDIVCYNGLTHTSVFIGDEYKFYEGGSQCVKDGHYPNGIKLNYEKYPYKISEILRFKDKHTEKKKSAKEEYDMLPVIKKGDKGRQVRVWQAIIDVNPDGIFGDKTDKATRDFQKKHGLTVDGIVGKFTWGKGIESLC